MLVELLDYRPQRSTDSTLEKPDKTRVVLHPTPETLYADLVLLNQRQGNKWSDRDALKIEAAVVVGYLFIFQQSVNVLSSRRHHRYVSSPIHISLA